MDYFQYYTNTYYLNNTWQYEIVINEFTIDDDLQKVLVRKCERKQKLKIFQVLENFKLLIIVKKLCCGIFMCKQHYNCL